MKKSETILHGEADDIQVFVVTYDRPDYLKLQLESLACQSVKPHSITILDDSPRPDARRVAERFATCGISYEHTNRPGLWGNLYEAQKRAVRPYVAIFHDDDRIHPRYIEIADLVIKANPEVTLVGCDSFSLPPMAQVPFEDGVDASGWLFDKQEFASFFSTTISVISRFSYTRLRILSNWMCVVISIIMALTVSMETVPLCRWPLAKERRQC